MYTPFRWVKVQDKNWFARSITVCVWHVVYITCREVHLVREIILCHCIICVWYGCISLHSFFVMIPWFNLNTCFTSLHISGLLQSMKSRKLSAHFIHLLRRASHQKPAQTPDWLLLHMIYGADKLQLDFYKVCWACRLQQKQKQNKTQNLALTSNLKKYDKPDMEVTEQINMHIHHFVK